jgi:N-acetyl sugar amidotransferase
MKGVYKRCVRCIMDTTAQDISFDEKGNCNFCIEFLSSSGKLLQRDGAERKRALESLISEIKRQGAGNRYDCVVGVSGGVDSSWVLHEAMRLGLRPLAVHMDNGWNSELAQNNIANMVKCLGVDLYTHVIDWNEYRNLMQEFFDVDVIDIELLYDNAMLAVNYQQAAKFGVRYILGGTNIATEGMRLPDGWNWFKWDKRQITAMARHSGSRRLATFPAIGTLDYGWYKVVRRIQWTSLLDCLDFNKAQALAELQRLYAYKPYPYKHYESIFTRFYQGYLLPTKFGVDKRLVHLSTLVVTEQMGRDAALEAASGIAYPSEAALRENQDYFLKKMGWSAQMLDEYLARPPRLHTDFPTERPLWKLLDRVYRAMRRRTVEGSAL